MLPTTTTEGGGSMRGDRWDVRALVRVGGGFVLVGVLELLMRLGPGIAVTDTVTIPYDTLGFPLVPQLVLLTSTVVLALRVRRTAGVARAGWIGLVVFGAGGVLGRLLTLGGTAVPPVVAVILGTAVQVLPVIGVVVGSALVARGEGLQRPAGWALLPLAAVELMTLPLMLIPSLVAVPALQFLGAVAAPVLLAAAGAAYLLQAWTDRGALAPVDAAVESR